MAPVLPCFLVTITSIVVNVDFSVLFEFVSFVYLFRLILDMSDWCLEWLLKAMCKECLYPNTKSFTALMEYTGKLTNNVELM